MKKIQNMAVRISEMVLALMFVQFAEADERHSKV
jgi:hypothetical protein